MIVRNGYRQPGRHVSAFDVFVGLRQLRMQLVAFDALVADARIEQAMSVRTEMIFVAVRLGMSRLELRSIFSPHGSVPFLSARTTIDNATMLASVDAALAKAEQQIAAGAAERED